MRSPDPSFIGVEPVEEGRMFEGTLSPGRRIVGEAMVETPGCARKD